MEITLTQGKVALIDDADYARISHIKWCAQCSGHGLWYARGIDPESGKKVYMHRVIMEAPDGIKVDHVNHHGLDKRRRNLRLCTHSENTHNSRSRPKSRTGYLGIFKNHHRYVAKIEIEGKVIRIGNYGTPEEAARARDAFAYARFGDRCLLNFPDEIAGAPQPERKPTDATLVRIA